MDALYKLFALSFIAERDAYRNVQSWENIAQLNGQPEPDYFTDKVYASLVNVWSDAETARRESEKALMQAYRKEKAEGTFSVMDGGGFVGVLPRIK
jgi:hypothetical protein